MPLPKGQPGPVIHEAELVDQLSEGAIRQICVYQSEQGYHLTVLPTWRDAFLTLVGTRTQRVRYYKSLDRLIEAITKYGELPPPLVIGRQQKHPPQ
jgi:hypothetical protein